MTPKKVGSKKVGPRAAAEKVGPKKVGPKRPTVTPITKILVANRGEIAVRVIRACGELGIRTVAVCSQADTRALHAELADQTEVLGPPEPGASYLRADLILEAARRTGADAVHPGYGFLAENAGFAEACRQAGLIFIGPTPAVIRQMGEKTAARALMQQAGVPVVPGALLPAPDADGQWTRRQVLRAADPVGFPLMIKAAFGGGGKGMRLVTDPDQMLPAAQAAAREARGAFGDGTVYLERYLPRPRHVEFQIFGDAHGNYVHLLERECSIQRRHQKIVEESPSPALNGELRERMGQAAVAAARAVGYQGAGTVEFLLDQGGEFYFLEMNTRLQVEHPVTECVTGLDLVRAQIRVAEGLPLPWRQQEIAGRGHAIECRIYAEDPARGFLPSLGDIRLLREPSGPGVRIDSGVRQGDTIGMHYDPLIAKLVVHAEDRPAAIQRALKALAGYAVLGVTTNVEYLRAILASPAFGAGRLHTGFLQEELANWRPASEGGGDDHDSALAVAAAAAWAGAGAGARGAAGAAADGPDGADLGGADLGGAAGGAATGSPFGFAGGQGGDPGPQTGRFRLRGLD